MRLIPRKGPTGAETPRGAEGDARPNVGGGPDIPAIP